MWPFRRAEVETRDLSIGDPAVAMLLGFGGSLDGAPSVTESTAMTLSAVYRAVSLIAGSIASFPLRTMIDSDGQRNRAPSFLDDPANGRLTPYEWKELLLVHQLLHGNAYLQHIRNGANALVGAWPVHPLSVKPVWDDTRPGGKRFDVKVKGKNGEIETKEFDSTSMTQIMALSIDGLQGLSPIAQARLAMSTAMSGEKAAQKMFVNGSLVGGLVSADEDVTEDEATTINSQIRDKTTGTDNTGALVFVNRKLKFQQWQLSAVDAQFLQSRSFQIEEIARWYGVPPHLLGQTEKQTSWGTGVAEQNRGLARYTLSPWTSRFEQRLSPLLPGGKFCEFDYSNFVRPSPETEIELLLKQIAGGLLTPNEARAIRNLKAVPGGDALQTPAPGGGPASTPPGVGLQEGAP